MLTQRELALFLKDLDDDGAAWRALDDQRRWEMFWRLWLRVIGAEGYIAEVLRHPDCPEWARVIFRGMREDGMIDAASMDWRGFDMSRQRGGRRP